MLLKAALLGAFAALATAQSSVLTFTRVPNPITDGEPQAITYATNDTTTPVTIILRKGASNNLQTVATLTKDAVGGQFIWTPPLSLPNGIDYALEIKQNNQVNYYGPFTVQGAIPASISASASAASANSTTTRGTSMGTGTMMSRNTTMTHPTVTTKKTVTTAKTTGTGKGTTTGTGKGTTTGVGKGTTTGTGTGSGNTASASPTGAASTDFSAGSSFALVFGALAAILYLH